MGSLQTPSPHRGDRRRLFAAFVLMLISACAVVGIVQVTDDTDASESTDYYSGLVHTSEIAFHINLDSLDPAKGLIDPSNVIKSAQRYSGDLSTSLSVVWSNMAVGAEIVLPTYLPGTKTALAEVSTYDGGESTYEGHYYLSGWSTTANGAVVMNPGDRFEVPEDDVTLYAIWTKIEQSMHDAAYHFENAEAQLVSGRTYTHTVFTDGKSPGGTDGDFHIFYLVTSYGEIDLRSRNAAIDAPSCFSYETSGSNLTFSSQNMKAGNYPIAVYDKDSDGIQVWWLVSVEDPLASGTFSYTYEPGVSGSSAPAGGTARYGQAFDLSGGASMSNPDTTKTLAGWTVRDGSKTTARFALGQRVVMYDILAATADSDGGIVLRADWEAAAGAVVLSMDGASLRNVTAYSVRQGQVINLPSEATTDDGSGVMKEGKTLIGWSTITQNTSLNGVALYAPGAPVPIGSSLLKAEAFFWDTDRLDELCTVTYNYNGGQGTVGTQKVPRENFLYLPMHQIAAPSDMEFIGWSEKKDATEADVLNDDVVQVPDSYSYTLYAVYREMGSSGGNDEDASHNVWFNLNGGHGSVSSQSVRNGGYAMMPAAWPTGAIYKEGYVLDCWTDQSTGTAWSFDSNPVTKDTILKASWIQHFTYAIDPDDGMRVTITVLPGESKRTPGSPYDQSFTVDWGDGTKDGSTSHTYTGVQTAYRVTVTSQLSDTVSVSSYRTLTGLEGEIDPQPVNVVVTFHAGEGEFPDGSTRKTVTIGKGETVPEPDTPDLVPVVDGGAFRCWTRNGIDFDFDTTVHANITLTASYTDIFTVGFDLNYDGAEPVEPVRVASGKSMILPPAGTRDGYTMTGWFARADGIGKSVGDPGASYTPTRDITLYAIWKPIPQDEKAEYTVSFDTGSGAPRDPMTVEAGGSITLPDSEWSGHTLSRWYFGSEPVGAPYEQYIPTESCTLRAKWLDEETGKEVDPGDVLIPEANIVIDATDTGWTLRGSGKNAQSFAWEISDDGGLTWSSLGVGKTLILGKDGYTLPGTYKVKLTVTSAMGHTASSTDVFIVAASSQGGEGPTVDPPEEERGLLDKVLDLISGNSWVLVLLIIGIAAALYHLRWFV